MKLKEGFILREVAGQIVVLPSGEEMNLNLLITLNDTAQFLWEHMVEHITIEELVIALCKEYDVSEETALACVNQFVEKLRNYGFLED